MRVLYLRNLYWPEDFGGNRYAREVTRRLALRGHDVQVLTGATEHSGRSTAPGDVRVAYFPVRRGSPLATHATNALASWLPLTRTVRRGIDVVLVGSYDVALPLLLQRTRPPSLFFYHSSFYSEAIESLRRGNALRRALYGPVRAYMNAVERHVLTRVERIVAVSDFSQAEIARKAPAARSRTRLIHTGVDTTFYSTPNDRSTIRRQLEIPTDEHVAIVVGRLVGVKRYDRAIDAAAELRRRGLPTTLIVVGDGPDRERLEAHARRQGMTQHVRFLGFLSGTRHRDALWAADIQLCSSEFENLSLALLEGLSIGLPVVGVPTGGTVGLLNAIDPRLLAAEATAAALADTAAPILEDADLRARLAERCRDHVRRHHDWERVVDAVEALAIEVAGTEIHRV